MIRLNRCLYRIVVLSFLLLWIPVNLLAITPEFEDISDHWARDAIVSLTEKGIIKGMDEDTFGPDKVLTRGQFIAMLHRALGIDIKYVVEPNIEHYFSDVDPDIYYAKPLYDLSTLGIINERNEFRGEDEITREEMVNFLVNGYIYFNSITNIQLMKTKPQFEDESLFTQDYEKAIFYAHEIGLIEGFPDGTFRPKNSLTRAQGATVLDRLLRYSLSDPATKEGFSYQSLNVRSGKNLKKIYEAQKTEEGLRITFSYEMPEEADAQITSITQEEGTLSIALDITDVENPEDSGRLVEQHTILIPFTDIQSITVVRDGEPIHEFPYPSFIKEIVE